MKRPTLEEVTAYCQSIHPKVDAMSVWLHYEANGWMVGKVPMKNWKAAVANWERMAHRFNGGSNARDKAFTAAIERSREVDRENEGLFSLPPRSGSRVHKSLQSNDRGIRHSAGQFRFNEGD